MSHFTEDDAQRLFDRLGADVVEDRPALAELVVAADLERARRRRTTRWVLAASVAAALVIVGGSVTGVLAHQQHNDVRPAGIVGDVPVVDPAQLNGTWRSAPHGTLTFVPGVGEDGTVEVLHDGRTDQVTLSGDGGVSSSALLGSASGMRLVNGSLVLLGTDLTYLPEHRGVTRLPAGTRPVTSVNQITGSWTGVSILGQPVRLGTVDRLVVTTSWLSVGGPCAVDQADLSIRSGQVSVGTFQTSRSCEDSQNIAAAELARTTSFRIDPSGALLALDPDGVEVAAFARATPTPGPSAPQLVGNWLPVGTPDAELDLTLPAGAQSGRVVAHSGDCAIAGIWYLTRDGTFVSSAGPTDDSPAGCDAVTPDLDAFENISRAEIVDGQLRLISPSGMVLVRYDPGR